MKISLAYVLRAVPAVLAIAFGAQAIFPLGQSYIVQTGNLVSVALIIAMIACGCIALVRPWNVPVPLCTFSLGMMVISTPPLIYVWDGLTDIWDGLWRSDFETAALLALFAIAVTLRSVRAATGTLA